MRDMLTATWKHTCTSLGCWPLSASSSKAIDAGTAAPAHDSSDHSAQQRCWCHQPCKASVVQKEVSLCCGVPTWGAALHCQGPLKTTREATQEGVVLPRKGQQVWYGSQTTATLVQVLECKNHHPTGFARPRPRSMRGGLTQRVSSVAAAYDPDSAPIQKPHRHKVRITDNLSSVTALAVTNTKHSGCNSQSAAPCDTPAMDRR